MIGTLGAFDKYDQYVQPSVSTETVFPAIPSSAIVKSPERIFVQSHPDNTQPIFIGKTGVKTDGTTGAFVLVPGSNSMLPFSLIAALYHISTGSQKIFITYLAGGSQ